MICLYRFFFDICVCVYISEKLYEEYRHEINSIFTTFEYGHYNGSLKVIGILIHSEDEQVYDIPVHCQFMFDTKSVAGYFYLANYMQEVISHILYCTTLHGSLVQIENKNILIVGTRKSGKTTLTKYLIDKYNAGYLDDDHIYIQKGWYMGLNMPLFVRNTEESLPRASYETFDEEGTKRRAIIPDNRIKMVNSVDLVLFPHYDSSAKKYTIEKKDGTMLFQNLMNNVRFSGDHKNLFGDLVKLSKSVTAYEIYYAYFDWVDKLLELGGTLP